MTTDITLREMAPADGPALAELGEQTPDTGAVAFHSSFHHDVYASLLALRPTSVGVVAEAPDHDGIVGSGMLSFGECCYEGEIRPYAYLYALGVHPAYRRRGIASRIAAWRVETARQRMGKEGVIFAGIQQGNEGSLLTARTWSTQRLDRTRAGVVKMRAAPPKPVPGLEVRPALASELEEIAEKQNGFYRGYNLYPPETAQSLHSWRSQSPFGFPLHNYYVAGDARGNILAGLGITEEGRVISSHIVRMAWPLRAANVLLRLIPAGGEMRRLSVEGFWYAPGRLEAGLILWESMRWLWRDRGTTLMTFFDPLSPLARAVPTPWLMPSIDGSIVLNASAPMREDHLIYLRN